MGNCADLDDIGNPFDCVDADSHCLEPQQYKTIQNFGKDKYQRWRKPIEPINNLSSAEYLRELFFAIENSPQLTSVLSVNYLKDLKSKILFARWTSSDQSNTAAKIIEEYVQFCSKQLQTLTPNENVDQIMKNYAQQLHDRVNNAINRTKINKVIFKKITYYFLKFKKDFKFNFDQIQINKICEDVKIFSNNNPIAICYFSQYLALSCRNLEKSGKNVDEINTNLRTIAEKLKDKFGVLNTRKQLGGALSNNDQYMPNSALISRFQSVKRLNYKPVKIQLCSGNKNQQLENKIMEFVDFGVKNLPYFNKIVQNACLSNEGFNFKSNLKLTSKKNVSSLMRVKQKLLKNFMKDAKPITGCSSIEKAIDKQSKNFKDIMNNTYKNLSEIEFSVSDILRGKCLFSKKQHIYKAAEKIMDIVEEQARKGKSVAVVQVDDRFSGICQDLVFKIRIGDLVCEFQMALYFFEVQNTLHHKMYELVRSKLLSPMYLLHEWNHKATIELFNILQKIDDNQINHLYKQMKDFFIYGYLNQKSNYMQQNCVFVNRIPEFLQQNKINLQKLQKIKGKAAQRVKNIQAKDKIEKKELKFAAPFQKQGNLTNELNTLNSKLSEVQKKQGYYSLEAAGILISIGSIYNIFQKYQIAHVLLSRAQSIYQGIDPKCEALYLAKFQHAITLMGLKRYRDAQDQYLLSCGVFYSNLKQNQMKHAETDFLTSKNCYYLKNTAQCNQYSQLCLGNFKSIATNGNKQIIANRLKQMSSFWASVNENAKAQSYLKESENIATKTYSK